MRPSNLARRLILLLVLPILACGGLSISSPRASPSVISSPQEAPVTEALPPQTETTVLTPTTSPPTPALTNASAFPDSTAYRWEQIAGGLSRPVDIQNAGDDSGRLFVVEKSGRIRIIQSGTLLDIPFLDITGIVNDGGNEQGLLGLAFHPNYEQNGYFYVDYVGNGGSIFISRFQVTQDPNIADPNNEKILLNFDHPFRNHNGGVLAFGPDGYLYAGSGDGGSADDPFGNGQNTDTLLGKILRIDVDNADPYLIPSDNPFGSEIWAYGLRNPWRMSFDRATGDLWIGDVGQDQWEEIDYLPAGSLGGANFGWKFYEGSHKFSAGNPPATLHLIFPVAEYSHAEGCSVTGGYVYRGGMPEWQGIYLYGDYCSGTIWGVIKSANGFQSQVLFGTGVEITSFGQDESGEIYLSSDSGDIYRLTRK
jgi:glucose/arabinose dehydrogenase